MRETRNPKIVKLSSLKWLVNFLNLRFGSERAADQKRIERFLGEPWPRDDVAAALKAQKKIVNLIDLALKANSPEELVEELNHYISDNSESRDPRRQYPPVRPYWHARRLDDMSFLGQGEAILKMGPRKWVVHPAHLMHGTEGRAWLSIIQCLENGEFERLRRCLLKSCRLFFDTDDARRKFCKEEHQRLYDAEASKERVKASRKRAKAKKQGLTPPKREAKETPPSPITDAQRFEDFLRRAQGSVQEGSDLALIIKKIPGKWPQVRKWFAKKTTPDAMWAALPETTKYVFRREWKTIPS
jgi:hypothetical protein